MRALRLLLSAWILTSCAMQDGQWFPGLTVGIVALAAAICFFGWRYFISGQRHARRDDRQDRREERREERRD